MTWEVKVHEDHQTPLPYSVTVNGAWLTKKSGGRRRFGDSMKAAVAGAKEVDRIKAHGTNSLSVGE